MASVILELLEAEGRGTYLHGKLCFPEWAPEVRERVRNRFASGISNPHLAQPSYNHIGGTSHGRRAVFIVSRINRRLKNRWPGLTHGATFVSIQTVCSEIMLDMQRKHP